MLYQHHFSVAVELQTTLEKAFEYLNDPRHLSSHMKKNSWMMAGSKMEMILDVKEGKTIGSEVILCGRMLGIPLFIKESVVELVPSKRKAWETRGPQKMIILDQYKMGFEITLKNEMTLLEVFIDYNIPEAGIGRLLGLLLSQIYARWCTVRMATDAATYFQKNR